jgi:hypothetical protein
MVDNVVYGLFQLTLVGLNLKFGEEVALVAARVVANKAETPAVPVVMLVRLFV